MSLLAVLAFGSCDEFEDKDSVSPVVPGTVEAVRFYRLNPNKYVLTTEETSFEVVVVRSNKEKATTVDVTVVNASNYFDIPSSVSFAAGEDTVVIEIGIKEDAPMYTNLPIVLELEASDLNPYSQDLTYFSTVVFIKYPCSHNEVKLAITFDGYGSETTWKLTDEEGEEVFKGGPYKDGQASAEEYLCVPDGKYTFTVYDEFGDGLSYPKDGLVSLTLGELVILEAEGDFGASASSTFTMTDGELVLDAGDDEGDE